MSTPLPESSATSSGAVIRRPDWLSRRSTRVAVVSAFLLLACCCGMLTHHFAIVDDRQGSYANDGGTLAVAVVVLGAAGTLLSLLNSALAYFGRALRFGFGASVSIALLVPAALIVQSAGAESGYENSAVLQRLWFEVPVAIVFASALASVMYRLSTDPYALPPVDPGSGPQGRRRRFAVVIERSGLKPLWFPSVLLAAVLVLDVFLPQGTRYIDHYEVPWDGRSLRTYAAVTDLCVFLDLEEVYEAGGLDVEVEAVNEFTEYGVYQDCRIKSVEDEEEFRDYIIEFGLRIPPHYDEGGCETRTSEDGFEYGFCERFEDALEVSIYITASQAYLNCRFASSNLPDHEQTIALMEEACVRGLKDFEAADPWW